MIKTVFLDMDGVLVDFVGGIHKTLNKPFSYSNYPYELGKWDILEDIPHDFYGGTFTFSQVDAECTKKFWLKLPWMCDGKEILRFVEEKFSNIYLLTSPMPNPGSWTGKQLWVEKHLPAYTKQLIITQVSKSLFASPETLLIDDRDKNVFDFQNAGGKTILVPRLWNCRHDCSTLETIKLELENL